jgi:2-hydroxychromene-2-carboxylate isomerase
MSTPTVEMYIDPLCPWAWLTSRWLYEAEKVRSFTVVTKLFSLAEINREDERFQEHLPQMERPLRVLAAARRTGGEQALRAVYAEIGEAHHERDEPLADDATLVAAVTAAGLDGALVPAALADSAGDLWADVLRDHAEAVDRGAFGVASLSVDGGAAFFGPIVDRRITGEEAGKLWDVVLPVLVHPHIFELKRPRTSGPDVGRARKQKAAEAVLARA